MSISKMVSGGVLIVAVCFLVLSVASSNVYAVWGCGSNCEGTCTEQLPVAAGGDGCNGGTCTGDIFNYCEDRDTGPCGCGPEKDPNWGWICVCK